MKNKVTLFLKLFFLIILTSCSNDEAEQSSSTDIVIENPTSVLFEEENPFLEYLAATGFNQVLSPCINNNLNYEIGFKFKPVVKGKINSVVVKLANPNTNLIVTIWDVSTKSIIRTESVNVTTSNTEITKNIVPIELVKDKEYAITMNTTNYYMRHQSDWGQPQYPITAGNIKIFGPVLNDGIIQGYPTMGAGNFYNGDCSFNFLQTE